MHTHSIDYRADRGSRGLVNRGYFVWFGLPDNPLCWLLGHAPRVVLVEARRVDPYVYIDCRRCGRRYAGRTTPVPVASARDPYLRGNIEADTDRRGHWGAVKAEASAQVVIGKGHTLAGISVGLGGLGSETPIDVAVSLPGLAVYANTSLGRRVCEKITRGQGSREFRFEVDGGFRDGRDWTLRLTPWARKHESATADPWWVRGWRVRLHPADRLWGERRYTYEPVGEPVEATVRMPDGDDHPVTLQLRRETFGRPRGGPQRHGWTVDWHCDGGIPYRSDRSWKGDTIIGSGAAVTDAAVDAGRWPADACAAIADSLAKMRSRYGWRAPEPEVQTG